ncbi:MAG: CCA tRNA nucleotidyltransferase [Fervidicoccaceae archaeon]
MRSKREEIERSVLVRIKPSPELYEEGRSIFSEVANLVRALAAKEGWTCDVRLEGSFAKDTWLATSPELDIFVLFDEGVSGDKIKTELFPRLLKIFEAYEPVVKYSEHPYLSFQRKKFKVEVVPATRARPGEMRTAVDRTPYHTKYVLEHSNEELRDQMRLLKQFSKAVGVYGAEIAVEGFSGYLLELLTIYYGGFGEVLEAASKWEPPVVIDLEGYYRDEREAVERLGKRPLVVVDPVDERRNVASALSLDKMMEFSMASRLYLTRPSVYYFFPEELPSSKRLLELLIELAKHVVVVEVRLRAPLPPDTLWGEAKRLSRNVSSFLENEGYDLIRCSTWTNESTRALVACLVEEPFKPGPKKHAGPPVTSFEHTLRFVEAYAGRPGSGPWIEGGRLYALKERRHVSAPAALESALRSLLVSHLREGEASAYSLSWRLDLLDEEPGAWLREFLLGKPRWLLPYCLELEKA